MHTPRRDLDGLFDTGGIRNLPGTLHGRKLARSHAIALRGHTVALRSRAIATGILRRVLPGRGPPGIGRAILRRWRRNRGVGGTPRQLRALRPRRRTPARTVDRRGGPEGVHRGPEVVQGRPEIIERRPEPGLGPPGLRRSRRRLGFWTVGGFVLA
ncbi:hypothetical protein NSERUTF1_1256 [Nocardia seriolae]|nr:hypothetical protein NSERUTF1_1256 [Nocardia seriolae]